MGFEEALQGGGLGEEVRHAGFGEEGFAGGSG
jgi:hypothetical protein